MIQALLSHAAQDAFDDDGGAERQDLELDDEGEISFRRVGDGPQNGESVGETSSMREMRQGGSSDTESLSLLELTLAVLREERQKIREEREMADNAWRIQKEKIELGVGQSANSDTPSVRGDIARLLPRMNESEILTFFSAYERILTLHGVAKQDWSKFLGGCLTPKAHKALSGLSLAQHKEYDVCKKRFWTISVWIRMNI